ncbi:MAG: hypothetical protein ACKOEM_04670 [Planctomycetia bacterium]
MGVANNGTLDLAGRSQTFSGVSGAGGTIALGAGTLLQRHRAH